MIQRIIKIQFCFLVVVFIFAFSGTALFSNSLNELEAVFQKSSDFSAFLKNPILLMEYKKKLDAYLSGKSPSCETFQKTIESLQKLEFQIPEISNRAERNTQHLIAAENSNGKLVFKAVPRAIHSLWFWSAEESCAPLQCNAKDIYLKDPWTPLLKNTDLFVLEKEGKFSGSSLLVVDTELNGKKVAILFTLDSRHLISEELFNRFLKSIMKTKQRDWYYVDNNDPLNLANPVIVNALSKALPLRSFAHLDTMARSPFLTQKRTCLLKEENKAIMADVIQGDSTIAGNPNPSIVNNPAFAQNMDVNIKNQAGNNSLQQAQTIQNKKENEKIKDFKENSSNQKNLDSGENSEIVVQNKFKEPSTQIPSAFSKGNFYKPTEPSPNLVSPFVGNGAGVRANANGVGSTTFVPSSPFSRGKNAERGLAENNNGNENNIDSTPDSKNTLPSEKAKPITEKVNPKDLLSDKDKEFKKKLDSANKNLESIDRKVESNLLKDITQGLANVENKDLKKKAEDDISRIFFTNSDVLSSYDSLSKLQEQNPNQAKELLGKLNSDICNHCDNCEYCINLRKRSGEKE